MKMPYILKNKDFAKNAHSTCELSLVKDGEAQACWIPFQNALHFIYMISYKINENAGAKSLHNTVIICSGYFEIKNVFLRQNRKSWAKCYPQVPYSSSFYVMWKPRSFIFKWFF